MSLYFCVIRSICYTGNIYHFLKKLPVPKGSETSSLKNKLSKKRLDLFVTTQCITTCAKNFTFRKDSSLNWFTDICENLLFR